MKFISFAFALSIIFLPSLSSGMIRGTATIGGQYLISEEGISEIDEIPIGPASTLELAIVGSLAEWTITGAMDMIYSVEKGPKLRIFRIDSSGKMGSVTLGDYYERISDLTISGTVMKGIRAGITPFKDYGLTIWGARTRPPREPDPQVGIAASYARYILGTRAGLLSGDGPRFAISAIYGWDDEKSISNPGILEPKRAGTAGLDGFLPIFGEILGFDFNLFLSSSGDGKKDLASITGISISPTKGVSVSGLWKRIGTDFETLGNPYLDADRDGFEFKAQGMGKFGTATASGSLSLETFRTNLVEDPTLPKVRNNGFELSGSLSSLSYSVSLTYRLLTRRGQEMQGTQGLARVDSDTHWAAGTARMSLSKGTNISLIGQVIAREDRSIPVASSYSMYFGGLTISSEPLPSLSLIAYLSASSISSEAAGGSSFLSGIGRIQWSILPSRLLLYIQGSASTGSRKGMEEILGVEAVQTTMRSRFRGSAEVRYYISLERAVSLEYGFFRDEREDGTSYDGNMISLKLISGF